MQEIIARLGGLVDEPEAETTNQTNRIDQANRTIAP
jgi:hypothetical protein